MTFASRRFEVKANPWGNLGTPGLANLSDLMPDDDERLKWMYTQYRKNQASFNPVTGEFYPNYGQLEGIGPGGAPGGGMMDRIPRISPINEGMLGGGNSNGCPAGFYQFGQVCVPSVDTRGGSGSDLAGAPGTFFGKGDAKGIINAITPPQFTTKNQEFIVLTDMQNIGGQPAKFFTRIAIPDINLSADVSNSTMVMPLAKTKIGHRIIMPLTVTSNNLLQATVELMRIPITGTGAEAIAGSTVPDDRGQVAIPSPNYRGPQPPVGGGLFGAPNSGYPLNGAGFPPTMPPPFGFPPPMGFPPSGGGGYPPMPPGGPPFPYPPPSGPIYPGPFPGTAIISILPFLTAYPAGTALTVSGSGFQPGEDVQVQLYSTTNMSGTMKYRRRLVNQKVTAAMNGFIPPTVITIPANTVGNVKMAVIGYGNSSKSKAEQLINVIGVVAPIPTPGTGGGSGGNMGGLDIQEMMDRIFGNVRGKLGNLPNMPPNFPQTPNMPSGGGGNMPNFPQGFPFNQQQGSGGFGNPSQNTQGFINNLFGSLGMNN